MEKSSQEKKVVKSKKNHVRQLRNNIEALIFHIVIIIILISTLNIGLKSIGYDLLSKLPNQVNYVIGISALFVGYWYLSRRILLRNAK